MATQIQTAPSGANGAAKGRVEPHAPAASTATGVLCPDPSAHRTKGTQLQDHASAAALYSTKSAQDRNPLGPDGKLSSASAATSLKYARAHELPSFPVVGIDTHTSAGTAATLANANKKSPDWWKPTQSEAAGKAALLANDYKMAPLWKPEASAAGSKAALLAHKGGSNVNLWTPSASSAGQTAATLAFKNQGAGNAPVDRTPVDDRSRKALTAATGAVSQSRQQRSHSTPTARPSFPDADNSARNALNAAKLAHKPSLKAPEATSPKLSNSDRLGSPAMEAARIQHAKSISRDMYTDAPPVRLEVEEKQHNAALRASAVSMAKQIYDYRESRHLDLAGDESVPRSAAEKAHGVGHRGSVPDIKKEAMRYIHIQEAAQKLAAERLAKIGPDDNAAFRSYYGYDKPNRVSRARLSIFGGRNRASTNPEDEDSSDEEDFAARRGGADAYQSRRIRMQMNQFNTQLASLDDEKRTQDRKSLFAAAERKVQAQMKGLDQKVFDETGKMSPAMMDEWDAKARARAAALSEARMENHGKVHIGNGKYMDQADINAVAQARIQPTLDEINEKTEKRRAEEEERRLELEEQRRERRIEKERADEIKAEERRAKDEEKRAWRSRTAEEKAAAKQEKEVEKEKRAEEKRMQKEVRRKSREAGKGLTGLEDAVIPGSEAPVATEQADDELYGEPTPSAPVTRAAEADSPHAAAPTSPTSPNSKGFRSFLNKLARRNKHSAASAESDKPGFIGGASLGRALDQSNRDTASSSAAPAPTQASEHHYSDVSSISSGRPSIDDRGRTPQRTASGVSGVSGVTDPDELRDEFDEELAPPPIFATSDATAAGRKGSPTRDSKFHEIGI